ncbi:MAG: hypothetical protein ABW139_14515 [Candidatus Thiodiazotropha sp. DIVDIV]
MIKYPIFVVAVSMFLVADCADQSTLTMEQLEKQSRADEIVSSVLFEHELDEEVSYNVRKDGFIVVKFAKSVRADRYRKVVEILRSSPEINVVRAEQGGREVCKLTGYQ